MAVGLSGGRLYSCLILCFTWYKNCPLTAVGFCQRCHSQWLSLPLITSGWVNLPASPSPSMAQYCPHLISSLSPLPIPSVPDGAAQGGFSRCNPTVTPAWGRLFAVPHPPWWHGALARLWGGHVFYFPRWLPTRPRLLIPHPCPFSGPHLFLPVIFSD